MPTRLVPIIAALALAPFLRAPLAHAAEREATLAGSRLAIDSPCARTVDVQPDPALHDRISVRASAAHEEELDHLLMQAGPTIAVGARPGTCWRPDLLGSWRPTLTLSVRVPPHFAVAIDESSVAAYTLGDLGGDLTLDLSGVSNVEAGSAAGLVVDLSGMGHVRVAAVAGEVKLDLSGGGTVGLGRVSAPRLSADLSGAGGLSVETGDIGEARLESSGVGTTRIGAVVGGAQVDLSGMGSVHFSRVTGQIRKEVSGLGDVTVGP